MGGSIPDAVDPPSDTPASFQNYDLEIMGEQEAGHQAGEARADNSQSRPQLSGSPFAGNQPVIDRKSLPELAEISACLALSFAP